jgi:cytochrome c biogenesis protein CcmG/thiol:disulfide interchange protein DsbE
LFFWISGRHGAAGVKRKSPGTWNLTPSIKDRGLAVIGVSMDEDGWKTVRPFLALDKDPETGGHTAMKYPVVIGSDSLAKQYNLTSMPMTLLIDREGRIAVSHTGMVDKDDWESKIRSLLKIKPSRLCATKKFSLHLKQIRLSALSSLLQNPDCTH